MFCIELQAQSLKYPEQLYAKATFAGGCFWHLDSVFARKEGVIATQVGYTGGEMPYPTYRQVAGGTSGHVETIQITYDPEKISFTSLLKLFLLAHNPAYPYRKNPGPGAQYQSIIFCHDTIQQEEAHKILRSDFLKQHVTKPIYTRIIKAKPFYPAEAYHQDYFIKKQSICKGLNSEN